MKKKKILIIIAAGILIGGGLAAAFYFYNAPKEDAVNKEKNIAVKPDTSDWLTYENKEYGYRFKYPREAKVVDGKKHAYTFGKIQSTLILLPEKYPEIKDPNYYDEDIIIVQFAGRPEEFGETTSEIAKRLSGRTVFIKQSATDKGIPILMYSEGQSYIIGKRAIYSIHLLRQDPKHMRAWLNEDQLAKLTANYSNESRILEKICSTFEIFDLNSN